VSHRTTSGTRIFILAAGWTPLYTQPAECGRRVFVATCFPYVPHEGPCSHVKNKFERRYETPRVDCHYSPRPDLAGCDSRNSATEGDTLWVQKKHEPFQFTFNGLLKVEFQGSRDTSDSQNGNVG
jgi:hypothetical protein